MAAVLLCMKRGDHTNLRHNFQLHKMTTSNKDISEQLTQRTEDLSITDNLLTVVPIVGRRAITPTRVINVI